MVSPTNAPLVEAGVMQLEVLAEEMIKMGIVFDALYASPLLRAQQSASVLARKMGIKNIFTVDDLRETDPNSAEGHSYKELAERGGDIYRHPFSDNQETLEHLVERTRLALAFVLSDARSRVFGSVGIMGHGDPLDALDWVTRRPYFPSSYGEMKKDFYPQKGEAYGYQFNQELGIILPKREIITTYARTVEGFRNP